MKYTIEAKATKYDGIVFRSLLEARCYAYLKLTYDLNIYEIEYEPNIIQISHLWNPDFSITLNNDLCDLIEVKPVSLMFDSIKYIACADCLETTPQIICMDDLRCVTFNEMGGFKVTQHDEVLWVQTFNMVRNG
jgi:hypothetical protein